MRTLLRGLHSAMSPVAVVLALLALVVSSVGAGYAAATIGAQDIKKNAVTAAKIKKNAVTTKKIKNNAVTGAKIADGSVTNADLVPEAKATVAALLNGGEGDCAWQSASLTAPGLNLGAPAYRKDRSGRVHLSGVAVGPDAPGGDATCDALDPGQIADGIAFVLPAGYVPAKTIIVPGTLGGEPTIIAGAAGLTEDTNFLPPGAVYSYSGVAQVDSVSFDPADSGLANGRQQPRGEGLRVSDTLRAAVR